MMNTDQQQSGHAFDRAQSFNHGLRAYMQRVYGYMATGLAITGVISFLMLMFSVETVTATGMMTLTPVGRFLMSTPVNLIMLLATVGIVFYLSVRINKMSAHAALMWFYAYAALVGAALTPILFIYTASSIYRVFFITSISFMALSIFGYVTKRDLGPIGSFLFIGLFGLIIASLVNMFLQSTGMDLAISAIGVLIFAGLTAYDTQRIKNMYATFAHDGEAQKRVSIMGALSLYLNFINMFLMLLRFFGDRR